jgi:hypothetical protein
VYQSLTSVLSCCSALPCRSDCRPGFLCKAELPLEEGGNQPLRAQWIHHVAWRSQNSLVANCDGRTAAANWHQPSARCALARAQPIGWAGLFNTAPTGLKPRELMHWPESCAADSAVLAVGLCVAQLCLGPARCSGQVFLIRSQVHPISRCLPIGTASCLMGGSLFVKCQSLY